jgi:hypothetical protein
MLKRAAAFMYGVYSYGIRLRTGCTIMQSTKLRKATRVSIAFGLVLSAVTNLFASELYRSPNLG